MINLSFLPHTGGGVQALPTLTHISVNGQQISPVSHSSFGPPTPRFFVPAFGSHDVSLEEKKKKVKGCVCAGCGGTRAHAPPMAH